MKEIDALNREQLKTVLRTLHNGCADATFWLCQINAFYAQKKNITREHRVYLWLIRNGLIGRSLCQFFENEGGFLNGLNHIINRIEGRKFTNEVIKIDEAY